jgi:hypothetical protein
MWPHKNEVCLSRQHFENITSSRLNSTHGIQQHFFIILMICPGADVAGFGPVTQGQFLQSMGIETRLKMLLQAIVDRGDPAKAAKTGQPVLDDAEIDRMQDVMIGACQRLVDPAQMGQLFKVLCIAHRSMGVPPAFEHAPSTATPVPSSTSAASPSWTKSAADAANRSPSSIPL